MKRIVRRKVEKLFYLYYLMNTATSDPNAGVYFKWKKVIEETLNWFDDQRKELAICRYLHKMTETQLCLKFYIRKTTLYSWINEFIEMALIVAACNGLITVNSNRKVFDLNEFGSIDVEKCSLI